MLCPEGSKRPSRWREPGGSRSGQMSLLLGAPLKLDWGPATRDGGEEVDEGNRVVYQG